MKYWLIVVGLAGCHKADDCERVYAKSKTMFEGMAKQAGKSPADLEAAFLKGCRQDRTERKSDPEFECVLAATTDDAVRDCWTKGFTDYRNKSIATEAKVMLRMIGNHAKMAVAERHSLPAGTAKQLPAKPCCDAPDHRCPASQEWATDPLWTALEFTIDDPTRYQYTYTSDGQTFTATATGDLQCDGHPSTLKLEGKLVNGELVVTDL